MKPWQKLVDAIGVLPRRGAESSRELGRVPSPNPVRPIVPSGRAAAQRHPYSSVMQTTSGATPRPVWRIARAAWLIVGGLAVFLIASELLFYLSYGGRGGDWAIYREAASRWLDGGSYFLPRQLIGTHPLIPGDVLYPPAALVLFVPFTLLPPSFWWLAQGIVIGASLIRLRPRWWAWPAMAILAASPVTVTYAISGNPLLAMVAVLFAWAAWGSPASLVLLKPSLLPFALPGVHTRAWWAGLAAMAVVSLAMLPLMLDWVRVITTTQGTGGLLYGLPEWPTMAIPLVAWAGARRRARLFGTWPWPRSKTAEAV